jgi:opacity protein-like surface antigen
MSKRFFSAGAAAALAMAACAVSAHEEDEVSALPAIFEVTPFLGYTDGGAFEDPVNGSERDLEGDQNWGLLLNLPADYSSHYELLVSHQSTEVTGAVPLDMDVQYLQIGGTVSYPYARRVIPYFGMTAGAARFKPGDSALDDETKWSFSAGAGVRVPVSQNFGVRFDARAFVTLVDTDSNFFCISAGGLVCRIRARSDTLVQYAALLGLSYRF